jgi:hypothetical protein
MIAQHLGAYGVPWPEALDDAFPYNANLMAEWNTRRSRTKSGQKVYLALNAVNQSRNGVAGLWEASGSNHPLPSPWDSMALNDPRVKIAYLNYCRRAIAFFNPDFLTIGIEVNQVMAVDPSLWAAYLDLHRSVYLSLKSIYPSLPIMVSLTASDLLGYVGGNAANQALARTQIADLSDYFCLSLYLYQGSNAGGSFPADAFDRLAAMTSKPMAICETGYPSQGFTLRSGDVVQGSPSAQKAFFDQLFQAADKSSYRFIVNFFLRDLADSVDISDIVRTFRYDGLYDVNGSSKTAFASWQQQLARRASGGRTIIESARDRAPVTRALSSDSAPGRSPATSIAARDIGIVYTNDNRSGPNTITAFAIGSTGELMPLPGSPFGTGGSGTGLWRGVLTDIVATPQGRLYVANHGSGDISVLSIDPSTGGLASLGSTPLAVAGWTRGALSLAASPDGRVLAASNSDSGQLVILDVGSDGSLAQRASTIATGGRPIALAISQDSRFVSTTFASDGRIGVFEIGADHSLQSVTGSPFFGSLMNANTLAFTCASGLAYAAGGTGPGIAGTSIEIFRARPSGALERMGAPLVSEAGLNGGVGVLSPDNAFLFVSNQGLRGTGGDSVSVFRADGNRTSLVAGSPFAVHSGGTPVGMATTRAGEFLMTANYPDNRDTPASLGVFAVAPDGSLRPAPGSPVIVPGSRVANIATFPSAACPSAP